ncbi:MAG: ABC transporter permease [Clostridiales bacterium]|nr:ABC transporter permease [Clostridiales bacterium]
MKNLFVKFTGDENFSMGRWIADHAVTLLFWVFIILGLLLSEGVTLNWFLTELSNRFYRNAFLIFSLIIPVVAGLGMNFGIVVGAMSGQLAIIAVQYFQLGGITNMSGLASLILTMVIALPISLICGYLTGVLFNKTRGQEMIASLIVGYFGNGIYQFIVLFVIGAIIPVAADHVMVLSGGVGIRMSVDMGLMKYALEDILQLPFAPVMLFGCILFVLYTLWNQFVRKLKPGEKKPPVFRSVAYAVIGAVLAGVFAYHIAVGGSLTKVRQVPVVLVLILVVLAFFIRWIMTTKLGQDFRSCGQNQYIAESNGINVDRTRVIATMISTVLAAWGMIIYLQNIGTLNTYTAHTNIGFFAVAALLVGGASVDKANITQAITGCLLFHSMFILSPEIGSSVFGQAVLGEYFRTFMVYGVIGLSLGLYVWRANKARQLSVDDIQE